MKYRMYIDEVGNHDLESCHLANNRYLNLTAVIMNVNYVREVVHPVINSIKERYFGNHHDPDDPVVLHRKEILNHYPPFECLKDPEVRNNFNADFLRLVTDLDYVVISVFVDKQTHFQIYGQWANDPYHYCLEVLMERFILWLRGVGGTACGDIMAESRGGKEDLRLKNTYGRLYRNGTANIHHNNLATSLTSGKLKIKPKSANVAGLQFADLLAHPLYKYMIAEHERTVHMDNFGTKICDILKEKKIRKSPSGDMKGWGLKWLP